MVSITGLTILTLFSSRWTVSAPASDNHRDYFFDHSNNAKLEFRHYNGMSGNLYLMEIMGPGAALLDYDKDGDLDIYLVQGQALGAIQTPAMENSQTLSPARYRDRLFRNELISLEQTAGNLEFTDVTDSSGIDATGYGMGVASGDFDNDGWTDLYVTNFGKNQLLRNRGDGSFEDVTDRTGTGDTGWSVSAAFFDYNRDGWLDLYVGNYLSADTNKHKPCRSPGGAPDYCTPLSYPAQQDRLYRNLGNGRFRDVTGNAGIAAASGPALGVMVADYNLDGWLDIYVANDSTANILWINQGDGRFRNQAYFSGTAVNMAGAPEASMGVSAGDFDNDGDQDLFMTHLTGETNTLYVNDGQGGFEDQSIVTGLGGPSKAFTGFGTVWLDVDNDGWLDVFSANGEVSLIRRLSNPSDPYPLHQTNQLFMNRKAEGFKEITQMAGPAPALSEVSRGLASGDLDNDGDTDLLIANNNGPARLLINQIGNKVRWIGLSLIDLHGRDALGAQVELRRTKAPSLWRRVGTDGSYASASDPRVLLGLGGGLEIDEIRVHWPDQSTESWSNLPRNQYTQLRQGSGKPVTDESSTASTNVR